MTVSALIDTGANISCVSRSLLHRIGLNKPLEHSKISQVFGVGGYTHKIEGCSTLAFMLGGKEVEQTFYVFPRLH